MSQHPTSPRKPTTYLLLTPRATQNGGTIIGVLILLVFLIAMLALAAYVAHLDNVITKKFEGKRWDLPAKVYSAPLEIYQGAPVSRDQLIDWLAMINYQSSQDYKKSGSYSRQGNTVYVHARTFDYGDSKEPAQVLKINFSGKKISHVQSTLVNQNESGIVQLEPVLVGGIYPDNNEDRIVVALEDIPTTLVDALIATEDRQFYTHKGVSVRGIIRAVLSNVTGGMRQGGSTITQQLIKNFYLSSERTLKRKANEAIMAVLLELHYSKDEILQTYLNEINLGQRGNRSINGFGLAAQFYFNKPLTETTLAQQALLVGMAKGPSQYNPRNHPDRALERRNVVLNNMLVTEKISQADYDAAIAQPLQVVENTVIGRNRFPTFMDIVKRELASRYKESQLKTQGLRIFTTMNPLAQIHAEKTVGQRIKQLKKSNAKTLDLLQAALVSADPKTGELVAAVGSANEFTGFNRTVDAKRHIGSLIKPVVYYTSFNQSGLNLASPVSDAPVEVQLPSGNLWRPQNYDNRSHGTVAIHTALAKSYNQAAVRLGMQSGVDKVIEQLHRMGIDDTIDPYPSTLLGAINLSPMQVLTIYQTFANNGFTHPVSSIRKVIDIQGKPLQQSSLDIRQALDPAAAYITHVGMQSIVAQGTAKKALALGKNLGLAGKTGTTNGYRDAWFAGYSGNNVSVVWIGRDDNKPINLAGGSGALPIWIDYMRGLNLSPNSLTQPPNIEWMWLADAQGLITDQRCSDAIYTPVRTNAIPSQASQCALRLYQQDRRRREAAEIATTQNTQSTRQSQPTTPDTQMPSNTRPSQQQTLYEQFLDLF